MLPTFKKINCNNYLVSQVMFKCVLENSVFSNFLAKNFSLAKNKKY